MRKLIVILALAAFSCNGQGKTGNRPEIVSRPEFELIKADEQHGLLILFPCFPCDSQNTLSEFKISDYSLDKGFSILALNMNQRLFLTPDEKKKLAEQLETIISKYDLSIENIFMGGFSSGGNVSLLIANYLVEQQGAIRPKGVFVVDSPIDLLALYTTAQKNLKLQFSEASVQEATWIKSFFDKEFGNPEDSIANYEKHSPFTLQTQNIENLKHLKNLKIRFYTEPDVQWWQENRKNDYEDLNAYYLKELSHKLKTEWGNENIQLIETDKQGYRANGERHPHSWSIVDKDDLLNWMME